MNARILFALVAPLLLLGCVLTPGKFVSTLRIDADRSFAFAYKGEVIALDPSSAMKGIGTSSSENTDAKPDAEAASAKAAKAADEAQADAKYREMAATLAKEHGYRSVTYQGKGKFLIDYAVTGKLTHGFVYPYNSDAEAVFPFLAIEVRKDGLVRVKAPGFAGRREGAGSMEAMGGSAGSDAARYLDGRFTLDTDAEIVSQNNEDGAKAAGGRRTIAWRATPLTKDAPTAVLRLKSE
jgi:hypothetical protein